MLTLTSTIPAVPSDDVPVIIVKTFLYPPFDGEVIVEEGATLSKVNEFPAAGVSLFPALSVISFPTPVLWL